MLIDVEFARYKVMNKDIVINGIMGFIIGDALGVPLEFKKRDLFKNNKVTDMISSDRIGSKGVWSDDSSMVIATMKSIIDNKGKINYESIMDNFILWVSNKDFIATDKAFGIGRATFLALGNYHNKRYEKITDCGMKGFNYNGNGSLMRILPIAYYCYYKKLNDDEIYHLVKDISSLTHSHEISVLGCFIYVLLVIELLSGEEKENAYSNIKKYNYRKYFSLENIKYYDRLLNNDISKLNVDSISSMGFIVDTLEAVIWCFINNNSYDKCVIEAINLGNDSDTIGALVGGLSGIYYGNLPSKWLDSIVKKDYLLKLSNDYYNAIK